MRGKVCSAEFMRRLEKLVQAGNGRTHKDLVKFIASQTCLTRDTIRNNLRALALKAEMGVTAQNDTWPTILTESLDAPDPLALATQALEEGWTVVRVRAEDWA